MRGVKAQAAARLLRSKYLGIGVAWARNVVPHDQKKIPMHVQQMVATHPDVKGNTADKLLRCIEE